MIGIGDRGYIGASSRFGIKNVGELGEIRLTAIDKQAVAVSGDYGIRESLGIRETGDIA